jgi:hypothetical protein
MTTPQESTPQEKMQAFQSAQKFGKQFPGLFEALRDWATIGSLEQAAEETRTRLDALRTEEATLKAALGARTADADAATRKLVAEREREFASARAIATALIDEAKLEARCLVEAAQARAAELVNDAERRAAEHQALLTSAKHDLAGVLARIEAKSTALASLSAAVEEKQAQHERFAKLVADLKAKL